MLYIVSKKKNLSLNMDFVSGNSAIDADVMRHSGAFHVSLLCLQK